MPTYEYVCSKCHHVFEHFQSISEPPLTRCPKEYCAQKSWGRGRVKRAISGGAGLLFKGSGFYITDYRSEGYKAAAKKDSSSPAPKSDGTGGSAKSESKPAAKPAPGAKPAGTST